MPQTDRSKSSTKNFSKWSEAASFPYKIDYNDHFETPLIAYQDILPLLDYVAPKKRGRESHTLYDPYYCNGRTKILLGELGFSKVQHERRDFYQDVEQGRIPPHDTLVTNPPYSDQHKEKCIEFALKQLRDQGKPFFILMPNYIASKEYYRNLMGTQQNENCGEVIYVLPPTPYEYDHPDGTGHEVPPFASIWYCGIGVKKVKDVEAVWEQSTKQTRKAGRESPRLAASIQELQKMGVIPTAKRPNPRQRKKRRRQKAMVSESQTTVEGGPSDSVSTATSDRVTASKRKQHRGATSPKNRRGSAEKRAAKKSRYRGADGVRKKRRF